MGIASDPDVTISEAIYASCPTLLYMFAGWKCHDEDHRRIERRQAEGHTWAYAHTPSQRTPTCALTLILSIHWYVQLSTGIFSELQTSEVCKFRQPYFPILKFSCVFVQHRSSPALYLIFFIFSSIFYQLSVTPKCSLLYKPSLFYYFFRLTTLNESEFFTTLRICAASCFCTTHLNATGIIWTCVKCYNRLLREKLKEKREMIKWFKVIPNVLLQFLSCSHTSFNTHTWMAHTHKQTHTLATLSHKWPIFIWLT